MKHISIACLLAATFLAGDLNAESRARVKDCWFQATAKFVAGYLEGASQGERSRDHKTGQLCLGKDGLTFDKLPALDDKSPLKINYEQIQLLARGQVLPGTGQKNWGTSIPIIISVAGAVASTQAKAALKGWLIGGALVVGGSMTWYLLHAARTENYMSIFFCSEDKRTCPDSQGKLKDGESKSNVAVFKIPNSHDYWNISMILNARTHQEFVEEPSVYAGKKDGK